MNRQAESTFAAFSRLGRRAGREGRQYTPVVFTPM
jgi:hypothetical protein